MAQEIGIIIASHGHFAQSMVKTADLILGRPSSLKPFDFPEHEDASRSARKLKALINRSDKGRGVIILSDLFGGTPGSLALSMLEAESVEVVSGVNLPMALAAATLAPDLDLAGASQTLVRAGQEAIREAGSLLKSAP